MNLNFKKLHDDFKMSEQKTNTRVAQQAPVLQALVRRGALLLSFPARREEGLPKPNFVIRVHSSFALSQAVSPKKHLSIFNYN